MRHFRLAIIFLLGVSPFLLIAQSKKKLNLEGDFYYDSENYLEAETFYQQSADKKNDFQSLFNLGSSQEKATKIEESVDNYTKALPYADNDFERAMAHYNIANTMFSDQEMDLEKLETVISHYKDAIRLNPDLDEAKHNLASAQIAKDMAQQQEQQQQEQSEEQEKSEDQEQQDQEQEDQQEQEKSEEEKEDQEQKEEDQQKNQDQQKQSEEAKEQEKKEVDQKEIENILKMVEKEDAEVQQKMRKQSKSDQNTKKKKW